VSKFQPAILGILVGLLVIEGLVFWDKNKSPEILSGEVEYVPISESTTSLPSVLSPEPILSTSNPISTPQPESSVVPVVGYGDVLVVINLDSSESQEIGEYFAAQRDIPLENLVYINATTSEEINDIEFQNIRAQIENHLKTNDLVKKINYIVTTKGVPLKIKREEEWEKKKSASVDSELTLMLSKNSKYIGEASNFHSPYFYVNSHFSKAKYDMYLVTRLDGYTVAEVRALIDRSKNPVLSASAKFVLDQDPTWSLNLNNIMDLAKQDLQARGFSVVLDSTESFLTNQQDVIGYASWGSNDRHATSSSEHAKPKNTWAPGAIAETYVSTSGRTFNKPVVYGQSVVADLIEEGVTGAKGYVYEPYANAMANVSVLFDRYTKGYNLAESFYTASPFLSWMDVVIGDPKMVLKIEK
jgi:uncharacterized protein (TIGR03790 family)